MENRVLPIIRRYLAGLSGVSGAYLFGSEAKGLARRESDIDLAVLFHDDSIPDFEARIQLQEELKQETRREVDLVVLNQANPILKYQVFKHGKKIFESDRRRMSKFLIKSLNEYADLKRVWAPIEKALLKGRLYG